MLKRMILVGMCALLPVALASGPGFAAGDFYDLTVAKKAPFANQYRTSITVSGTYTCSTDGWTPDPNSSGFGVNVSQIQGSSVVSGQGGMGGGESGYPDCDGQPHPWRVEVPAFVGGPMGGHAATWKSGKATVQVNGGVASGNCQFGANCIGDQVMQVLQITNR